MIFVLCSMSLRISSDGSADPKRIYRVARPAGQREGMICACGRTQLQLPPARLEVTASGTSERPQLDGWVATGLDYASFR
jgi:hypothetical protein